MRPFAERRAARIERLRARAERRQAEGQAKVGAASALADRIPFGQPILVGHHSERRARRDAERIHNGLAKGFALQKEAAEIDRRADAAEANTAISSDDPEAISLLRAKLGDLQKAQERMKALNALFRKGGIKKLAEIATETELAAAKNLFRLCSYEKVPYPGYALSNNSANIRRIEKRIAELEAQAARPAAEPVVIGEVTIDELDNRTRIHFPGKPPPSVIADLKSNGFRWCRSDSCWQRMASPQAQRSAATIVELARKVTVAA